jgi:anti-anti-sigma regulatory factor
MFNLMDPSVTCGDVEGPESDQTPLRNRYWVAPSGGGWTVAREEHILAHYPHQPHAAMAVLALAEADRPSELFIRNSDGQIEEHMTFDPEPGAADTCVVIGAPDENDCPERFPIFRHTEHQATMMVEGNLALRPWLALIARLIMDELEDPELQNLVVDMGRVTDFNIQSVAWWVGLERFVREQGRTLVIVNASPAVHGVLKRMGIDELVEVGT